MDPKADEGATRRAWPLSLGLTLMAIHQAYFIAPNWASGAVWEAFRHVVGSGGLLLAAAVIGTTVPLARPIAGIALGAAAAVLVMEVFVVAAAAGIGAWPTWIFVTWAGGMTLVTVSVFTAPPRRLTIGLGSGLVALAFAMFLVRHFADAPVGVIAVLFLGIAGAFLTGSSGGHGEEQMVDAADQVNVAE